jgi:hypothetical protein
LYTTDCHAFDSPETNFKQQLVDRHCLDQWNVSATMSRSSRFVSIEHASHQRPSSGVE